jgi:hypothetical protein
LYNGFIRIKSMATNHRKMTCKEALKARYKVSGRKSESGYGESAVGLSYEEAQRFFDSLTFREFDSIKVIAYWDEHVFYSG